MPTSLDRLPDDVLEAVQRGNNIEAIKLLRAQSGLGLKEAKDAVDAAEPAIMGRPHVRPTDEGAGVGGKALWFVGWPFWD